jgi:hypothetical protein
MEQVSKVENKGINSNYFHLSFNNHVSLVVIGPSGGNSCQMRLRSEDACSPPPGISVYLLKKKFY